jgi:hypothetical protein
MVNKIIEIDRTSWHSIQSSQQLTILTNPDESGISVLGNTKLSKS